MNVLLLWVLWNNQRCWKAFNIAETTLMIHRQESLYQVGRLSSPITHFMSISHLHNKFRLLDRVLNSSPNIEHGNILLTVSMFKLEVGYMSIHSLNAVPHQNIKSWLSHYGFFCHFIFLWAFQRNGFSSIKSGCFLPIFPGLQSVGNWHKILYVPILFTIFSQYNVHAHSYR